MLFPSLFSPVGYLLQKGEHMKSKYIVFPEKRQVDVLEEEIASPAADEILCAAEKSLISIGTELHCLNGVFEPGTNWHDWVKYPFRPGYSMVGRVIAVGEDVAAVKEGDRIANYGLHQQYYKVKLAGVEKRFDIPEGIGIYVLPDAVSSEDGTWRSLAVTTQNAVRRAQFQFGEVTAVVGLGILGQLVTQFLAVAGARIIIAIDLAEKRLELARKLGATHTLQMPVQDAQEAVREITEDWMLDVVFDVTGHPAALAPCTQLVRRLGRLVLLGDTPTPGQQHLGPGVLFKSIAILGLHGYAVPERTSEFTPWTVETMSTVFFDYLMREKVDVSALVTHHYSPLQAPEAYLGLLEDRSSAVGVIFDWDKL
jgi:2-desacetyl-2-hydroxyethyl bacteriochlorophyllide A dehydrogenase